MDDALHDVAEARIDPCLRHGEPGRKIPGSRRIGLGRMTSRCTGWSSGGPTIWAVPTGGRLISPAVNSIMSFIEASIRRSTPCGSEDE